MNFSCTRVYQNCRKIKHVISPKCPVSFVQFTNQPILILIRFLRFLWIHLWLCQWFWTLFFPNFIQVMDMPAAWLVNCLLGYCLPFSAPLYHISDRAGSHQKFTWHWAFCSIPKRITSSTHMATVISVEAKKMKSYCPPPSPPDFSKNHYCSNANTAVAGGEGGGQEKTKNGYFKTPIFFRGSGKPLNFKENDSNKSPRQR